MSLISSYGLSLARVPKRAFSTVEACRWVCKHLGFAVRSFRQRFLQEIEKIPSPWNEIVNDMMIQVFGWLAEEESNKKSERIKNAIRKDSRGRTFSYKGNRRGRRKIDIDPYQVVRLRKKPMSIRKIAEELGVNKGVVERCLKNLPSYLAKLYKSKS